MQNILNLIEKYPVQALLVGALRMIIILLVAWICSRILRRIIKRFFKGMIERSRNAEENNFETTKRLETITGLILQGLMIVYWVIIGLIVMNELGVKIGPILASAGIVGLAIGFGAQNLVRDVISGFFIIMENQVRVGDVAIVNGTGGLVERIHFRTLTLRDLSGVVHIFPNGTITTMSNMTKGWSAYVFEIGVAYKENVDRVMDIIRDVCAGMRLDPAYRTLIIEDAEIFGVDKFDDSAVVIKGRIKTKPIQQWIVGREFLRRIKNTFDANNIEIPFPHRTLYVGEASKPFDVALINKTAENSDTA